jgi:hypothetical protein
MTTVFHKKITSLHAHYSGVASSISGGHIYSYSQTKKQSISKEIDNAEHEYINMSPPPPTYRAGYATGPLLKNNTHVQ